MKALYKSILILILAPVGLTAVAQKDTTLVRQVLLEREYTPTLQDASKINTKPAMYTPALKQQDVKFVNTPPQLSVVNNQLGAAGSGDIKTTVDFSKKQGYVTVGAGNYSNMNANAGYRVLDMDNDKLDIFANHSSTNGMIDFLQQGYALDKVKAKYADTKVNLRYQHVFEPSILSFDASFFNTGYNYYGNSFMSSVLSFPFPFDVESKQNVDVISIGGGIKASDDNGGALKYKGYLNYRNFKNKYGLLNTESGVKGGQIDLDVDFFTEIESDRTIGIRGAIMNQSFGNKISRLKDAYNGFTNITATPYIKFQGANWNTSIGLNLSSLFDVKQSFVFTPDVTASIHLDEKNTFYGSLTGGVNNNTFLDILHENRYLNPISRVEYSKTMYNFNAGFKSGFVDGFEFDIFAGYKRTNTDHLFTTVINNPAVPSSSWGNLATPLYANVSTGQLGGLIKTNLIPYTDLSARAIAYFYQVKYVDAYVPVLPIENITEKKAWGRPNFTMEFNADVRPIEKVTLSLNYQLMAGRKAYVVNELGVGSSLSMKNINELNFRGEYQITDWISANLRLNNMLGQKYELVYGYTLQSFNVLGGLSFKF